MFKEQAASQDMGKSGSPRVPQAPNADKVGSSWKPRRGETSQVSKELPNHYTDFRALDSFIAADIVLNE